MANGAEPARLPAGAPRALRDFVACTAASVELDTTELGWVPSGPGGVTPDVTVTPGDTAGTATVRVGWEFVGVDLPASIGPDGALVVDTSGIPEFPGVTDGLSDGVDDWVRSFNDTMAANGKRLDRLAIDGKKVTLTKRPIAAVAPAVAPAAGAAGAGASGAAAPTPEPAIEPATEPADGSSNRGCLLGILGAAIATTVGVVALVVATQGDDAEAPTIASPTDVPLATDVASATDAPSATDASVSTDAPVATDAPSTDAPSATDPVATDSPAPTDAPSATDGPTATPAPGNGSSSPLPAPFSGVDPTLDALFDDPFLSGAAFAGQRDASNDVVACESREPAGSDGIAKPDIANVAATTDGQNVPILVALAQPPTQTAAEDFSFAVVVQTFSTTGARRTFQYERHDGVETVGERDESGVVDPSSGDVAITDAGVQFVAPNDPTDPLAGFFVQAFNTPVEGDPINCDEVIVIPFMWPLPPSEVPGTCEPDDMTACVGNGRFSVTLTGPDGPMTTAGSDFDDAAGFESGDGLAWARVVSACPLSETFWVFGASLTDVDHDLSVVDTATGTTYTNPLADDFQSVTDTSAFATCP